MKYFKYLDILLPLSWFFAIITGNIDKPICGALIGIWLLLGLAQNTISRPWSILLIFLVLSQLKDLVHPEAGLFSTAGDLVVMCAAFGVCYNRSSAEWHTTQRIILVIIYISLAMLVANSYSAQACDTLVCFEGINRNRSAFIIGYAGVTAASMSLYSKDSIHRISASIAAVIALLLVIGLGSRAGIVIPLLSLCTAACISSTTKIISKRHLLVGIIGIALSAILAVYYYLPINSSAGRNKASDLSRIEMQLCYVRKTLEKAESFLLGSGQGSDRLAKSCHNLTIARHHAHNYYIQIFGENGFLSVSLLLILLSFIIIKSRYSLALAESNLHRMQAFWGLALIVYISMYALIESLPLRFGLIQILHSMALAIPFAKEISINRPGTRLPE